MVSLKVGDASKKSQPKNYTVNESPAYYTTHPPFNSASRVAIAAVGPTALAIQYGEVSSGFRLDIVRDSALTSGNSSLDVPWTIS